MKRFTPTVSLLINGARAYLVSVSQHKVFGGESLKLYHFSYNKDLAHKWECRHKARQAQYLLSQKELSPQTLVWVTKPTVK